MVDLEQEVLEPTTQEWVGCDQCPAKAAVLVELPYGELAFCRHHYNANAEALTKDVGIATLLA